MPTHLLQTLDREAFNSAFEIQSRQIGRIIQRQSEEKSEKNAERVNGWLERYFNSRMDDNHDRHCKERRYKDSGKWFTDEVVSWLKGESNMIFWNRGIRKIPPQEICQVELTCTSWCRQVSFDVRCIAMYHFFMC